MVTDPPFHDTSIYDVAWVHNAYDLIFATTCLPGKVYLSPNLEGQNLRLGWETAETHDWVSQGKWICNGWGSSISVFIAQFMIVHVRMIV